MFSNMLSFRSGISLIFTCFIIFINLNELNGGPICEINLFALDNGVKGLIESPNYPFNYTQQLDCRYTIYLENFPSTQRPRICFRFLFFRMADSSPGGDGVVGGCFDDYLLMPGLGRFCGKGRNSERGNGDIKATDHIGEPFCVILDGMSTDQNEYGFIFKSMSRSSNYGFLSYFWINYTEIKSSDFLLSNQRHDEQEEEMVSDKLGHIQGGKLDIEYFNLTDASNGLLKLSFENSRQQSNRNCFGSSAYDLGNVEDFVAGGNDCAIETNGGWEVMSNSPSAPGYDHTTKEPGGSYLSTFFASLHTAILKVNISSIRPIGAFFKNNQVSQPYESKDNKTISSDKDNVISYNNRDNQLNKSNILLNNWFNQSSDSLGNNWVNQLNSSMNTNSDQLEVCLSFWYYMNGNPGSLSVYLENDTFNINGKNEELSMSNQFIWRREGWQDNQWLQGEVSLTPLFRNNHYGFSSHHTRVSFVGQRSFRYDSFDNIAIDDISISPFPCHGLDISCAFELDDCGWKRYGYPGQSRFNRTRSLSQYQRSKDFLDRFQGNGYYMLMKGYDSNTPLEKAGLISRPISFQHAYHVCLLFYYNLFGSVKSNLELYTVRTNNHQELVFKNTAVIVNVWKLGYAELERKKTGPVYRLLFNAYCNLRSNCSVAIDDVQLIPGKCRLNSQGAPLNPPMIKKKKFTPNFQAKVNSPTTNNDESSPIDDSPMNNNHDSPMNNIHDSPMNNNHYSPMNNNHDSPMNNHDSSMNNNNHDSPINNSIHDSPMNNIYDSTNSNNYDSPMNYDSSSKRSWRQKWREGFFVNRSNRNCSQQREAKFICKIIWQCISRKQLCDRVKNCLDGTDEMVENCLLLPKTGGPLFMDSSPNHSHTLTGSAVAGITTACVLLGLVVFSVGLFIFARNKFFRPASRNLRISAHGLNNNFRPSSLIADNNTNINRCNYAAVANTPPPAYSDVITEEMGDSAAVYGRDRRAEYYFNSDNIRRLNLNGAVGGLPDYPMNVHRLNSSQSNPTSSLLNSNFMFRSFCNNFGSNNLASNNFGSNNLGRNNLAINNLGSTNLASNNLGRNNLAINNLGFHNLGSNNFRVNSYGEVMRSERYSDRHRPSPRGLDDFLMRLGGLNSRHPRRMSGIALRNSIAGNNTRRIRDRENSNLTGNGPMARLNFLGRRIIARGDLYLDQPMVGSRRVFNRSINEGDRRDELDLIAMQELTSMLSDRCATNLLQHFPNLPKPPPYSPAAELSSYDDDGGIIDDRELIAAGNQQQRTIEFRLPSTVVAPFSLPLADGSDLPPVYSSNPSINRLGMDRCS